MSDSRVLLNRISTFRRKLEQMPTLADNTLTGEELMHLESQTTAEGPLDEQVLIATRQQALLERSMRQLQSTGEAVEEAMPSALTARARRLMEEGRALIAELRPLADDPLLAGSPTVTDEIDPLASFYRELVCMAEVSLRMVVTFPESPSAQMRLSEGLESVLVAIRERLAGLNLALAQRRKDHQRIDMLAGLLVSLERGTKPALADFARLAQSILDDATTTPMRFLHEAPAATQAFAGGLSFPAPARFIACHALTTAQVIARLVGNHDEWGCTPVEAVMLALVHDVGMMRIPVEILAQPGSLDVDQKRMIETHPHVAADLVATYLPELAGLADAIATHHERMDGTGYPQGHAGEQIAPLARVLAVADEYAARAASRAHRPAYDPRTALTDTLLEADHNRLDRTAAERLFLLAFYPIGSIVELADGRIARVLANPHRPGEYPDPARPVVAIVANAKGETLPSPQPLDLLVQEGPTIVRTLNRDQRYALIGRRYPEWV